MFERRVSDTLAQRRAVDELVGDEGSARRFADVVDSDDVRVIQRRCGFGLADEAVQPVAVVGELRPAES